MSDQQNEQMRHGDPGTEDRDAHEPDLRARRERRETDPADRLEDADEWSKDVPERGHGEDIG